MKTLLEYLVTRPLSGCIQGVGIGVLLPLTCGSLVSLKAGRVWAILLTPLWPALMVFTIPLAVVYCLAMVMVKGPLWQYPPHLRTPPSGETGNRFE